MSRIVTTGAPRVRVGGFRGGVSRRVAELIVFGVVVVLVAGVLLGTGFAQTVVRAADGLTWLGDDSRGEVIEVNPATGRPETRLTVAQPGHGLEVAQTDTLLVVTDTVTGEVTFIDLATLSTTGLYHGAAGRTKVLLSGAELYVADLAGGTIVRLDPVSPTRVGTAWSAGVPLADAVIDSTPTVWALDLFGTLHHLGWTATTEGGTLADIAAPRTIAGTGADTVLSANDPVGVTIFAGESGRITQTGTGTGEFTVTADALVPTAPPGGPDDPDAGEPLLAAAEHAPADLVPVAIPRRNLLLLFAGRATPVVIDTAKYGCYRPGRPAVYHALVYTPCDHGLVIVVDRRGTFQNRIDTGTERRPVLVIDDNRLFIETPGGPTPGYYVDGDGRTHPLGPITDDLPAQDPGSNEGGSNKGGNGGNGSTGTKGGACHAGVPKAPGAVAAATDAKGRVTITWQYTGTVDRFEVVRADTAKVVTVAGPQQRSAVVTGLPAGTAVLVRAVTCGGSAGSDPVTPQGTGRCTSGAPQPPTNLAITGTGPSMLTWQHTGTVDRYEIVRVDTAEVVATAGPGARSVSVALPAGTVVLVRAVNCAGSADSDPASVPDNPSCSQTPPDPPVNLAYTSDGPVTIRWQYTGAVDRFEVVRADTGEVLATAGPSARSARLGVLPTSTTVFVRAVNCAGSADSYLVTVPGGSLPPPGTPSPPPAGSEVAAKAIDVHAVATDDARVNLTWDYASGLVGSNAIDILRADTFEVVSSPGSVSYPATSAVVTSVPPGESPAYIVRFNGTDARSAENPMVRLILAPTPPANLRVTNVVNNGSSLDITVDFDAATPQGAPPTPVDDYTISTAGAAPITRVGPGPTTITAPCGGGQCWGLSFTITVTANSAAGRPRAQVPYTHPNGFPGGPQVNDNVIGDVTPVTVPPNCGPLPPQPPPLPCMNTYTYYEVQFDPPASWSNFGGTCTPIINGSAGTAFPCSTKPTFPVDGTIAFRASSGALWVLSAVGTFAGVCTPPMGFPTC
jgi:hypothetical protein